MTEELRELNGSVALVTGGGQGIGFALVEILVENGACVSILDINHELGCTAIEKLEKKYNAPNKVLFIKCDVTNKDLFEDAFKVTINKFGKINIVVNNAGVLTKYITSWEQAIDLNFKAVVHGTILGLKYIENNPNINSAVINIGSIIGLSNSILPIYQSTKRAIIEFTRCIGCPYNTKVNGNNVRIMAICPGPTFDGFDNNIKEKKYLEKRFKGYITNGEENPNPNRIIIIQSLKYIQTAFLHVMKNGKMGDIWIAENEEFPKLFNTSNQYLI